MLWTVIAECLAVEVVGILDPVALNQVLVVLEKVAGVVDLEEE